MAIYSTLEKEKAMNIIPLDEITFCLLLMPYVTGYIVFALLDHIPAGFFTFIANNIASVSIIYYLNNI
jgi:hypothetical protein